MKNAVVLIFCVLFCLTAHVVCSDVDIHWMKNTLLAKFSQPRHHTENPVYKEAAVQFVKEQFTSYGLDVEVQQFKTNLENVTGQNIIGILKGQNFGTKFDAPLAVEAHHDTVATSPGVNDNGSGTTVVLQVAKTLASQKCQRNNTILFMVLDLEEHSDACPTALCGPLAIAKDWIPTFWQKNYPEELIQNGVASNFQGVMVMDLVMNVNLNNNTQHIPPTIAQQFADVAASVKARGFKGDFITLAGRKGIPKEQVFLEKFQKTWNSLNKSPEFHVEVFRLPEIPGHLKPTTYAEYFHFYADFARSDHTQFWLNDIPAIFITDTAEYRSGMTLCYHGACDNSPILTDERMNFLGKTAQTLITSIADMANTTLPCPTTQSTTTSKAAVHLYAGNIFVIMVMFLQIMLM